MHLISLGFGGLISFSYFPLLFIFWLQYVVDFFFSQQKSLMPTTILCS